MNPSRWRHIKAIADKALDLDAAKRVSFLDEACGGHAELRAQVESLLESSSVPDDFLSTPATGAATRLLAERARRSRDSQGGERME